jgi:hypothetical protein
MVGAALSNESKPDAVNSIEKVIRDTVKNWQKKNPDSNPGCAREITRSENQRSRCFSRVTLSR